MVVFWTPEVKVGEPAPFQLSLTAPVNVDLLSLPISSLKIHFAEDIAPLIVRNVTSGSVADIPIRRVDLGHVSALRDKTEEVQADLRWKKGWKIVFAGTVSSDRPLLMNVRPSLFYIAYSDLPTF
jgi:trafficking protein particle complex subunit 11